MVNQSKDFESLGKEVDEVTQRALDGDISAFEILVHRHQAAVRGFLAARLSQREDAEDLAQEVFITAFQKRKTFSGSVKIESWLRGIARNLLRNHVRKFRAKPIGGSEELQVLVDRELEKSGYEGEVVEVLRECLGELDGPARRLVMERYLQGVSVRQLEKKTGRGYSALTMQLHRIRVGLAECIERKMGYQLEES